jgi:hypothetical protein
MSAPLFIFSLIILATIPLSRILKGSNSLNFHLNFRHTNFFISWSKINLDSYLTRMHIFKKQPQLNFFYQSFHNGS